MKLFIITSFLLLSFTGAFAQGERMAIRTALLNYIEGTSFNDTRRIGEAFFEDANLYLTKNNDLWEVSAKDYIGWFNRGQKGEFNGRLGNILSIDHFASIATAKAEILMPAKGERYIDMFLLKKIKGEWKIISKSADMEKVSSTGSHILFIVSNAHFYGNSELPTGNSYAEIVNAYDAFKMAGYSVDFVSPEGGSIPLAYINTSDPLQKKYLYDADFMYALEHTRAPEEINPKNYKAVHYIGGGSALFGVPENKAIQEIVMTIYEEQNGIISSVCHGTAGIVHLKTEDGNYLVAGKTVNGYPDAYEREGAAYYKQFPFKIVETIKDRGGNFFYSPRNQVHVEVDGRLITGQNYLSSKAVAERILETLSQ